MLGRSEGRDFVGSCWGHVASTSPQTGVRPRVCGGAQASGASRGRGPQEAVLRTGDLALPGLSAHPCWPSHGAEPREASASGSRPCSSVADARLGGGPLVCLVLQATSRWDSSGADTPLCVRRPLPEPLALAVAEAAGPCLWGRPRLPFSRALRCHLSVSPPGDAPQGGSVGGAGSGPPHVGLSLLAPAGLESQCSRGCGAGAGRGPGAPHLLGVPAGRVAPRAPAHRRLWGPPASPHICPSAQSSPIPVYHGFRPFAGFFSLPAVF